MDKQILHTTPSQDRGFTTSTDASTHYPEAYQQAVLKFGRHNVSRFGWLKPRRARALLDSLRDRCKSDDAVDAKINLDPGWT